MKRIRIFSHRCFGVSRRQVRNIFVVCTACVGFLGFLRIAVWPSTFPRSRVLEAPALETLQDFLQRPTRTCKLPNFDPFSSSVQEFIERPISLECTATEHPLLFELEDDRLILVGDPQEHGLERCCFSRIQRLAGNGSEEDYLDVSEICEVIKRHETKIPESIQDLIISCRNKTTKNWVNVDVFGIPCIKHKVEERIKNHDSSESSKASFNVIVLGLDGMSHLNFQRTMPLTRSFLVNDMEAFFLNGYSKVGDNTFPNLLPVLTGKSVGEIRESGCWRNDQDFLDTCPFIWKTFGSYGYRTVFGEDSPEISSFNYLKRGFKESPVDYYLRPMYLALDIYVGHENTANANFCYGPRSAFNVSLGYIQRFTSLMALQRRYFLFMWINSLSHDHLNMPCLGDKPLEQFLRWFHRNNNSENTILVLMSDHGMRWGGIRGTLQGKMEERMPFLYFAFPASFQKLFPRAAENLQKNRNRLSSHFDLHETLLDLIFLGNVSNQRIKKREEKLLHVRKKKKLPRGISLFLPIPATRSCVDAGIDDPWCICHDFRPVDSPESVPLVVEGAEAVVKLINNKFKSHGQCQLVKVERIIRVNQVLQEGMTDSNDNSESPVDFLAHTLSNGKNKKMDNNSKELLLEITFQTAPGAAIFEALANTIVGKGWSISSVNRLNLYKGQSECVRDVSLKPFCYCKS